MYRCRYTRTNDEKTTKSSLTPYIGHIFQHINICNCILSVLNRTTSLVVPHILGTLQRDGQVYFVLTVAARCQRKRQFNVSPRPNPTNPTNTVVWPLTGEISGVYSTFVSVETGGGYCDEGLLIKPGIIFQKRHIQGQDGRSTAILPEVE